MGQAIFLGLGSLLFVVGIAILVIRQRSAAKRKASQRWPTCEGRVVRAIVDNSRDSDGDTTYSAHITYTYVVNGQSLTADRVTWGGRIATGNPRNAEAQVARYPEGAAVRVTYNPDKPDEAVLEPAAVGGLRIMMFVAVGFIAVGLIFLAIGPSVQN